MVVALISTFAVKVIDLEITILAIELLKQLIVVTPEVTWYEKQDVVQFKIAFLLLVQRYHRIGGL